MAQPKLSQVTTSAFVNFRGARAFCWLEGERNFSDFRSLLPFPRSGDLEPRRAVERGQMLAGASPLPCFDLAPHGVWERFFQGWVGGGRALAGERQGGEREAAHTSRWCLTALGPSGAGQEGTTRGTASRAAALPFPPPRAWTEPVTLRRTVSLAAGQLSVRCVGASTPGPK